MNYLGDFPEDATVYIPFNTFTSDDPQASATITNLADADIKVHKDGSATQIVTDGATVAIDFDTITGNHLITIDTSAHADYSIGSDYMVRIEGTTVDAGTVNAWVGSFSIENRFNEADVTKWLGTAVATPTTAGVPEVDPTYFGGSAQSLADLKDFADAGYDPATNKVQGVVLVDTTTTNSDMRGTDGANTTVPDAAGVLPTAAENADAVWDEILTGATHNIATSAGRRLRGIQDFQGYENGSIWIDTVNGTAGTIDYENGTVENPVLTLADALTLNASLGFNRFTIFNGSTITLASTFNNYLFIGENWALALGGQDTGGTHFHGATVTGICTGTETTFIDCHTGNCTIDLMHLENCSIGGTLTAGAAGDHHLSHCHSAIAGISAPVFDVGAVILNTSVNLRGYSGGMEFLNLGQAGTDTVSVEGDGQVILNANCVGGSISIRGNFELTDNSATTTVNDDARYDAPRHVDLTWDEVISKAAHDVGQSSAKILRQGGDLVQIDGAVSDATPLTSDFDTNLTQADGYFDDAVLIFSNGSANAGIGRPVSAYLNASGNMTFDSPDAWPVTPVNGDDFVIFATHVHPVAQIADAVADEPLAGHTTDDTLGKAIADSRKGIILGAAATGTLSTTQATSDLTGYTDDQLIGRIITVTSGVAEGESSAITDYVETNGLLTFDLMTLTMGNGDTFKIT